MSLAELPQVQSLSVREKLELVDEIWKSVSSELGALEVSDDERKVLDGRWGKFLQDSSALTVDQFQAELRALRG